MRDGNEDVNIYAWDFQKFVSPWRFEEAETQRIICYGGGLDPAIQVAEYGQNFVSLDRR